MDVECDYLVEMIDVEGDPTGLGDRQGCEMEISMHALLELFNLETLQLTRMVSDQQLTI